MPFYYYRNSKCLGRVVSGVEKDLNLALIGYCGYFHFSLWQLELLFCGQFTEVLGYSADTSRAQSCQTLVLNYLCKLAGCTLNVQPANLHNFFFALQSSSCTSVQRNKQSLQSPYSQTTISIPISLLINAMSKSFPPVCKITFFKPQLIKVEWLGNPLLYVVVCFLGPERAQRSIAFLSF